MQTDGGAEFKPLKEYFQNRGIVQRITTLYFGTKWADRKKAKTYYRNWAYHASISIFTIEVLA